MKYSLLIAERYVMVIILLYDGTFYMDLYY